MGATETVMTQCDITQIYLQILSKLGREQWEDNLRRILCGRVCERIIFDGKYVERKRQLLINLMKDLLQAGGGEVQICKNFNADIVALAPPEEPAAPGEESTQVEASDGAEVSTEGERFFLHL